MEMDQGFYEKKSQSAVKPQKSAVKKGIPSKIIKKQIDEKTYFCFTCEFGTNDKKDYKRHLETKKHIQKEENDRKEMEEEKERKRVHEQEEIKRIFWKKHSPAICRNGCQYFCGQKYFDTDGITKADWLCQKCDEEECEQLFGFSKKPPSNIVIF